MTVGAQESGKKASPHTVESKLKQHEREIVDTDAPMKRMYRALPAARDAALQSQRHPGTARELSPNIAALKRCESGKASAAKEDDKMDNLRGQSD